MTSIVTGGGSGIGAAVVERLRAADHNVVVWDIKGGDIDCDISDPDAVSAALDRTVASHGVPNRLVACAGVGASGLLLEQTPADWQRVIDTNLTGTWLTMRAVAQAMVDHGAGGSIVAVSSVSGTLADRDMGAYCVSKAGIDMLVRVAAAEWGTHGIRVNAVGPGVTRTPMLANPEQLPGWVDGLDRTHRSRQAGRARRHRRGHRRGARDVLGHRPDRVRRRRIGAAQPDRLLRAGPAAACPPQKGPVARRRAE